MSKHRDYNSKCYALNVIKISIEQIDFVIGTFIAIFIAVVVITFIIDVKG